MQIIKFILGLFAIKPSKVEVKKLIKLKDLARKNFKYNESFYSETALKNKIDNTPTDQEILSNLMRSMDYMQRYHFYLQNEFKTDQVKIIISSGYRCKELNDLIGGSPTSDHLLGCAIDFRVFVKDRPIELIAIARLFIDSGIIFDQILIEKEKGIIHVGFGTPNKTPRKEVKFAWYENGNWKTNLIKYA